MRYFSEKINSDLKKIYFHRTITALAVQLAGVFSIIFLYQFFENSYKAVIILYVILGLLTIALLPLVGYFINTFSYRTSIIVGSFFRAFLWVSFFVTSLYDWKYGIILIMVSLLGIRVFYWVPYKTDFVAFRKKSDHSKSVSFLISIQNIVGIFSPILAGIIISQYSYNTLYGIGLVFLLLAIWPLKGISKIKNKFTWKYFEVFRELGNKKNRKFVEATFFNGVESMVTFIWPIFIFEILKGDYLKIGVIATGATLVVVLINLFAGKYTDNNKNEKSFVKYGTVLASLAWVIKMFVSTAAHIFFIDIYHRVSSAIYGASYQSLIYGYQYNAGKLVDEYTLISELAFRIGQTFSGALLLLLSFFVPMNFFFVVAAVAALLLNLIPGRKYE